MNGILGMSELVLGTELDEEQASHIRIVRSCARSLLRIINDVLDFSKVEAGKLDLDPHPFRLRAWLHETVGLVAQAAHAKGLELSWQVERGLPDGLVGDSARLRQVLVNLLGNAIKFCERGTIRVRVSSEAASDDTALLRFEVEDTGIGIDEHKQAKIFEAFAQAERYMTRRYGGTGLGLAICSRLVHLMGGTIDVRSCPGEGSLFFFSLPFELAGEDAEYETIHGNPVLEPWSEEKELEAVAETAAPAGGEECSASFAVLLVEDNLVNLKLAERMLEREGHEVVSVRSGEEAVRRFEPGIFDLVLMDIQMPEMDGLEATRLLRAKEAGADQHTPIIALTAHAMNEDRQRCLAAGMDDFLPKPIECAELRETMLRNVKRAAVTTSDKA